MNFLTVLTMTFAMAVTPQTAQPTHCNNPLVSTLSAAGFSSSNLREAWAIVMRESGGNPRSVSSTNDFGLFQLNRATWKNKTWWQPKKLLTAGYNAAVAYRLSDGGRTWYPWDIDGRGRFLGRYSTPYDFEKFLKFWKAYPCK